MRTKVLFLCTHNSSRSQMAEGLLRHYKGAKYEVHSAGTEPRGVHPMAVKVMSELGIDISGHRSKSLGELSSTKFDVVVTVCDSASEACPFFPGAKKVVHKSFPDPSTSRAEEQHAEFQRVRDMLCSWIQESFG